MRYVCENQKSRWDTILDNFCYIIMILTIIYFGSHIAIRAIYKGSGDIKEIMENQRAIRAMMSTQDLRLQVLEKKLLNIPLHQPRGTHEKHSKK